LRPHVRTRRSMERRGGRDSGKSVNGAMFGVVTRHFVFWPQTAHSSRTGRVHSTSDAICTARRPRMAGVRGAGPSKTGKRGANQRTVVPKTWTNCGSGMRCEFLGVNVRFLAREDGCPPPVFSCSPSKKATHRQLIKLDEDVLKDFSDGKNMPLEELFNTMCNSTRIQCKLITTSNKDPNLLPDGGIIRRAIIQQYTSSSPADLDSLLFFCLGCILLKKLVYVIKNSNSWLR